MTPKEKAEELADKFLGHAYDGISSAEENCIECALIAVDEILKNDTIFLYVHHLDFWKEVKHEINNL
jgi:hypothetical protein